jgi:hypothetical protein
VFTEVDEVKVAELAVVQALVTEVRTCWLYNSVETSPSS